MFFLCIPKKTMMVFFFQLKYVQLFEKTVCDINALLSANQ